MMGTDTLIDGLCFAEGPRWHEGRLWFSDMHDYKVLATDMAGNLETIAEVPEQPSGLGWLPDGRLLIVSMLDRKLLVQEDGELSEFASLYDMATYHCNDMVTDNLGRSYVGNFGFNLFDGSEATTAEIIMVTPDGQPRVVADEVSFPNGTVITPDGKTLIVGESMAARLTAFDIADDGTLSNRRVWAQLDKAIPDGICLDDQGGIWVASPISNEALRVLEGGEVTDRIKVENQAFACMLGGEDRKRLFILTAASSDPEECRSGRTGKIEYVDVEFPGAGLP
jgi:sugar lactone lactonase YvrE